MSYPAIELSSYSGFLVARSSSRTRRLTRDSWIVVSLEIPVCVVSLEIPKSSHSIFPGRTTGKPKWPGPHQPIQDQLLHQRGPRWRQVGTKSGPKIDQKWGTPSDLGAKNGVPHRPLGPKIRKKTIKKSNATKKRAELHRAPPFEPKKRPTWLQVGLQNRSKIDKKSMQKSIVFLMPLGVDF